jgi:hypothetical protein
MNKGIGEEPIPFLFGPDDFLKTMKFSANL